MSSRRSSFDVRGDVGEDAGERADAETRVIGDRDVMLAALLGGEPQVAPSLAGPARAPAKRPASADPRPSSSASSNA
jgi:hypothetical protein